MMAAVATRVLTAGWRALDHRPLVRPRLPATLASLSRTPIELRAAIGRFYRRDDRLLRLDWRRAIVDGSRTIEAPAVRLGPSVDGDPVVALADGKIGRLARDGSLRTIAAVDDAWETSVSGVGPDDVLTYGARPAFLGRLRRSPDWAWQLARVAPGDAVRWRRRGWRQVDLAVDGLIVAHTSHRGVEGIDAATGRVRWRAAEPRLQSVIAVVGDRVWCGAEHALIAFALADGRRVADVKIVSLVPQGVVDERGWLTVMPSSCYVHDLTDADAPQVAHLTASPSPLYPVREDALLPLDDGRVVGSSVRGDVFVLDPERRENTFLLRGEERWIDDVGVHDGRVYVTHLPRASMRGAISSMGVLEVFG